MGVSLSVCENCFVIASDRFRGMIRGSTFLQILFLFCSKVLRTCLSRSASDNCGKRSMVVVAVPSLRRAVTSLAQLRMVGPDRPKCVSRMFPFACTFL